MSPDHFTASTCSPTPITAVPYPYLGKTLFATSELEHRVMEIEIAICFTTSVVPCLSLGKLEQTWGTTKEMNESMF